MRELKLKVKQFEANEYVFELNGKNISRTFGLKEGKIVLKRIEEIILEKLTTHGYV